MTTTVTELEIIEEVDLDKDIPCGFEILHNKILHSQEPAKYWVTCKCLSCGGIDACASCDPCYQRILIDKTLGHSDCPVGSVVLGLSIGQVKIIGKRDL